MELKENTIIVVLGASGDLAKKKTVTSNLSVAFGCICGRNMLTRL